jgi:hypothetical protein
MSTPIYKATSLRTGKQVKGNYLSAIITNGSTYEIDEDGDIEEEEKHYIVDGVRHDTEEDEEGYHNFYLFEEIDLSTLMISFDNGLNWWKDFQMINDYLKRDLCSTMSRPKKECGCPDCGSSLIG